MVARIALVRLCRTIVCWNPIGFASSSGSCIWPSVDSVFEKLGTSYRTYGEAGGGRLVAFARDRLKTATWSISEYSKTRTLYCRRILRAETLWPKTDGPRWSGLRLGECPVRAHVKYPIFVVVTRKPKYFAMDRMVKRRCRLAKLPPCYGPVDFSSSHRPKSWWIISEARPSDRGTTLPLPTAAAIAFASSSSRNGLPIR